MPLRLTLKTTTTVPIEVDSIRLEMARSQTPAKVLATPVYQGNAQEPLGAFFEATGSAEQDNTLVWEGDCQRVKLIGAGAGDRIVVSHDSVWCWRGQPFPPAVEAAMSEQWNPSHFSLRIVPKLKDQGVTDEQLDALLIDNPRHFFSGEKLGALS